VLGRKGVGISDNFFELGGHSLLAVAICSKVKHLLGQEIPLRWIFDHPTIESLSQQIEERYSGGFSGNIGSIGKADRSRPLPMSFAQQGMWLLHQTLPDSSAYNVPTAVRLAGRVDRERVKECLRLIQLRHEVLRTALLLEDGNLVQQVVDANHCALPWRDIDLQATLASEQTSALQQLLEEEACQPFDLTQAPLWRVVWIQISEDEQVLVLTSHHSIMDEWSLRLFFEELSHIYDANGQGKQARLPELPVQYADYSVWQRERMSGEEEVVQGNYWREQLWDLPEILDLPGDLPEPAGRSGRGARQTFQISGEVVARLQVLSREESATSFMTALAAYQVWLYRYTGQSDVVTATPITGRERPEVQNLLGLFLNTLPIRCRMEGSQGFREILRQVRKTVIDAFDHSRFPFEKMVELAVKERNAYSQPLHQVMFVFLEQDLAPLRLDAARGQWVPVCTGTNKCDLTFSVMASEQGWNCELEYASDKFTGECAARMAGHLKELLEAIAEAPQKPLDQLRLMPDSERQQLLVEWNATARAYPQDKCIHQLFEEQVKRTPEAIALQHVDLCLSYEEINAQANRLAHHLRSLGVGSDALVGLCTERSAEMIIALLGILKAGGAYVPLDPLLPLERLRLLLNDLSPPVVLCQRIWQEQLLSLAGESCPLEKILIIEELSERLQETDPFDLPCRNTPLDLAYVMFTSGTTGQPKGVMVPHRGVVRLVVQPDYVKLGPEDVLLQFAPLSFDASTFEIWGSLLNGAKLVIAPSESLDFTELGNVISAHRVTTLWLTAALFHQMMELRPAALAGVRQLLAGGDVLSPSRVRDYLEMPGHGRLINGYGPTENTTFTCCGVFDHAAQIVGSVPIGRPIAGTYVYILDKQGEPVPTGVVGEIYAGGDGLARGYLNAPKLTNERFIADSFSSDPHTRLYRTGDLARWRSDGTIEFMGRTDYQVKIRGYRVELGEIENALLRCHGVSDVVVVVVVVDVSGEKKLVGYLVSCGGASPSTSELREHLLKQLPDHMVPGAFVTLERLPLTPNGKIDRKALPAPAGNRLETGEDFVAPRTASEQAMVEIWTQLLGVERISIRDNFFALGGHSLLAVRLVFRLRDALKVDLPLRVMMEYPTIAELSAAVEELEKAEAGLPAGLTRAQRKEDGGPQKFPVSFGQEQLWFIDQMEPESSAYNMSFVLRFRGFLNRHALRRSLDVLVMRHEILRTTFQVENGVPVQVVCPELALEMPEIELGSLPGESRSGEAQRLMRLESSRPFDLQCGPLLRTQLLNLGAEEHALLLSLHHIVFDGWSVNLFLGELAVAYAAHVSGSLPEKPALPMQYADFAVWQRSYFHDESESLDQQVVYWKRQLGGDLPVLDLPADMPRPAVQTHIGDEEEIHLPQQLADQLRRLSQHESATLFMTLLAAFNVLLHRHTGQEDIIVGSPIVNRNHRETEQMIGFFVNVVVLRTDVSGNPTFRQLLKRCRETCLEAYQNQDVPFERLVQILKPARRMGSNPIFQVMLNFLDLPDFKPVFSELDIKLEKVGEVQSKFDLTLYVSPVAAGIKLNLVYNSQLFVPARMREMLAQFHQLLEQIVERPDEDISHFDLVTPAARTLLPDPAEVLSCDWVGSVPARFAEQAQRVPRAIAVADPLDQWTYAELEARSNQLANYLCAHEIQPQDVVAIYGHRSASLVWALLGVWKAGAAFVILDPAHPEGKLVECLELADPKAWLQLGAAGSLPDALASFVKRLSCHLSLPSRTKASEVRFLSECSVIAPVRKLGPDDLAYIAFTSGTTGKPKGILGMHRPLSHFFDWHSERFGLVESDRFSMVSGLSYDSLLRDVFTPLWLGGMLCIPESDPVWDPERLREWLHAEQISVLHLVPSLGQLLLVGQCDKSLTSLRYAFFGGEVLSRSIVAGFRHLAPKATCVNFYGTTETPQGVGCYVVPTTLGHEDEQREMVPVGRGIEGVQLWVINSTGQLAGVGELGQIAVRSAYLSVGYLGDPALTHEQFPVNPYTRALGDHYYRTGDLARYLPGGNIEFVGRADSQVKIRGYRIELGEIERAIRRCDGVSNVAVVARELALGERQLMAYIVGSEYQKPDSSTLRAQLSSLLPQYMIPQVFDWLDQLPLTPNGKLDHDKLPLPVMDGSDETEQADQAKTLLELELTRIWETLFGRSGIRRHDNFFDLGGHSLQAAHLAVELDKLLGRKISIASLLQSPTIASFARRLSEDHWAPAWSSLVPLQPSGSKPPLFLMHGWGGNVYVFLNLARRMKADRPIYGVQAVGLDGLVPRHSSVEDMARHYAQEIRSLQPEGPYHLAGYSLGGWIAYAVAQELTRQGEKVDFLGLFDTHAGSHVPLAVYLRMMPPYLCHRLGTHLKQWRELPLAGRGRYFIGRWRAFCYHVLRKRSRQRLTSETTQDVHEEGKPDYFQVVAARYRPPIYSGHVDFFAAEATEARSYAFWSSMAQGGVRIYRVTGDHGTMLQDGINEDLARSLESALAQTSRGG